MREPFLNGTDGAFRAAAEFRASETGASPPHTQKIR